MNRLIAIQNKLKAPKKQYNSFGEYKFRNCEDILEAVKPLLNDQKLALIINDEIIQIEGGYKLIETSKDKTKQLEASNRVYVKATATLYDADGKIIATTSALAREKEAKTGMDSMQLTGATSSYARKYALNGLFAIDDTKDADTTNAHDKTVTSTPKKNKPVKDDTAIYEQVAKCQTIEELNTLWQKEHTKVNDAEMFKNICASRKAVLQEGAING